MDENIKEIGPVLITIKLYKEIKADLKVVVKSA